MRRIPSLAGIFVPLVTPMFDEQTLDLDGITTFAQTLLSLPAVAGLFGLGATGEFARLSYHERQSMIEVLSELSDRQKPIVVNTGGLAREQMLALSEFAVKRGMDAVALVLPDEIEQEANAVREYVQPLAEREIPFLIYWSPSFSKHRSNYTVIEHLMKFPSFVGIKDSSRDMVVFTDLCADFGEEIGIFQGVEMLHLCSLAASSAGIVGGGLNLYPRLLAEISAAFFNHDLPRARELQRTVNRSWEILNAASAFRSICKQYWKAQGALTGTFCRIGPNIDLNAEEFQMYARLVAT